jgi:hypothetical protein
MFMQSKDRHHSLANNLWAQLELAAAVVVILFVLSIAIRLVVSRWGSSVFA